MTVPTCTCRTEHLDSTDRPAVYQRPHVIIYCSLHAAAAEMYEALENARYALEQERAWRMSVVEMVPLPPPRETGTFADFEVGLRTLAMFAAIDALLASARGETK